MSLVGTWLRALLLVVAAGTRVGAQPAPDAGAPDTPPATDSVEAPAEPSTSPVAPTEPAPPPLATPPAVAPPVPVQPDRFPVALPDRPLVLPSGITELEFSYGFRTYFRTMTDMMGNVTQERTGFADDYTPELRVSHASGRFEVGAGFEKETIHASVDVDTGTIPGEFYLAAYFGFFTNGLYPHATGGGGP